MGENHFDSMEGVARGGGPLTAKWAARALHRPEEGCDLMLVPRTREW